jgi:steroid delta-isomerase-like uncharacterized protein
MTATDQNKKVVERLFKEVMNGKNFSLIDEIIAPGFTNHGIPDAKQGPAGFKETLERFVTAFPDMQVYPESIIAEGDLVATRGYCTGTNKGSFMGIPATGKKLRFDYVDFWKVQNGKCTENWVQMDMSSVMVQLGVMPAASMA